MTDAETIHAIEALRRQWGGRLLILGHHYQDSAIVALCDAVGDSLELSRIAAEATAERIVFCGVRFMAETADVLSRARDGSDNGRRVYQPAPEAGCPMADMATAPALEAAWAALTHAAPSARWVPVVYVNSSAEVKAFCGRHGGSACTSGNGLRVLRHFLEAGAKILFAPDQHLCANILRELGDPPEALALWRRDLPDGGLAPEAIRRARAVAWDGCCPIHAGYTADDIAAARAAHPGATLLIHPEAPSPVAARADRAGSTKAIIEAITHAEPGARFVVGTEQHLVSRLAANHPGLAIHPLRPIVCEDMGRTTPQQLLRVLRDWPEECLVRLPDAVIPDARACVERMLAL